MTDLGVKPLPSAERIAAALRYDPETGELWHRVRGPGREMDKPAGRKDPRGYKSVRVDGTIYLCHRLIWKLHHGDIPDGMTVDHINRNPADNRISNLRLADMRLQNRNKTFRRESKTGIFCISRRKHTWRVHVIAADGTRHQKTFQCLGQAVRERNTVRV